MMEDNVAQKLIELNRSFYQRFAGPFARSRTAPQPGFFRLLDFLPKRPLDLLDIGCGNGRFGHFLAEHRLLSRYTGLDFNPDLLAMAAKNLSHLKPEPLLIEAEMSRPETWPPLPQADLIVCLSALQHIPQETRRKKVMIQMARRLHSRGLLILANWQFLDSDRQRRKIVAWSTIDLQTSDVEQGDYLLRWRRGGNGVRYVNLVDEHATARLAAAAGLRRVFQFRADGKEGNLNLYTVLSQA